MTEREEHLLDDLLAAPPEATEALLGEAYNSRIEQVPTELTMQGERDLLRLTREIGPVTLIDTPTPTAATTLVQDIGALVRRYPLPTALAVAGAAYLVMRRRR
ncbi:MAG: hypothetical protein H7Z42_14195 [Roseiflexaceae bacterium]|nr:hypothetical protein [Roseiflexaceae bacterium]